MNRQVELVHVHVHVELYRVELSSIYPKRTMCSVCLGIEQFIYHVLLPQTKTKELLICRKELVATQQSAAKAQQTLEEMQAVCQQLDGVRWLIHVHMF